jgi:hypothetical protein
VISTANAARGQGKRAADRQRLIVVALETNKSNLNMKKLLFAAMIVLTRRSAAPGRKCRKSFKGIGPVAESFGS